MDTKPIEGDRWTRKGYSEIEVVRVTKGDVYYSYGGEPRRLKTDNFMEQLQKSIDLGAVLVRNGETWAKELEGFEI